MRVDDISSHVICNVWYVTQICNICLKSVRLCFIIRSYYWVMRVKQLCFSSLLTFLSYSFSLKRDLTFSLERNWPWIGIEPPNYEWPQQTPPHKVPSWLHAVGVRSGTLTSMSGLRHFVTPHIKSVSFAPPVTAPSKMHLTRRCIFYYTLFRRSSLFVYI